MTENISNNDDDGRNVLENVNSLKDLIQEKGVSLVDSLNKYKIKFNEQKNQSNDDIKEDDHQLSPSTSKQLKSLKHSNKILLNKLHIIERNLGTTSTQKPKTLSSKVSNVGKLEDIQNNVHNFSVENLLEKISYVSNKQRICDQQQSSSIKMDLNHPQNKLIDDNITNNPAIQDSSQNNPYSQPNSYNNAQEFIKVVMSRTNNTESESKQQQNVDYFDELCKQKLNSSSSSSSLNNAIKFESPSSGSNSFSYKNATEFIDAVMSNKNVEQIEINQKENVKFFQNLYESKLSSFPSSTLCNNKNVKTSKLDSVHQNQQQQQQQPHSSEQVISKDSTRNLLMKTKEKIKRLKEKHEKYLLNNNLVNLPSKVTNQNNVEQNMQNSERKFYNISKSNENFENNVNETASVSSSNSTNYGKNDIRKSNYSIQLNLSQYSDEIDNCTGKSQIVDNEMQNNKKRQRKRKDKKSRSSTSVIESNGPQINDETLLILNLLSLPPEKRDDYLFEVAKKHSIIVQIPGTDYYNYHPIVKNFFKDGQNYCNLNVENQKSPSKKQQVEKDKLWKIFNDQINSILLENAPKDKINEFTFDYVPRSKNIDNYFKDSKLTRKLEEYAKKCVDAGLGEIIESEIRINGKHNQQAFIKCTDGMPDAIIESQLLRKCALNGDIVRAFVCKTNDSEKHQQQYVEANTSTSTDLSINLNDSIDDNNEVDEEIISNKSNKAFVIEILQEVHNRKCVGTFLSFRKGCEFISFIPRDTKLPTIRIYKENWPEIFSKNTNNITDTLYAAKIIDWRGEICIGKILHEIGKCGVLESENKAILYQNNLNYEPYDENINKLFYGPLIITEDELKNRMDLRKKCIFTIDPLTARDLDDALSCEELSDGNYEIGVHISDVSHFLKENTDLDKVVSERTTSIYLVNEVFHMLPKTLCMKCSLLPGEDRFTFSILWKIKSNGEILDFHIKRTIINSCTQFAYEHAQKIIDNPNYNFTENDFPQIHNNFTVNDIVNRVKILNKIAKILRKKRFDNGALKINKPKLLFELDSNTGEPINYHVHELKTANFMIEEFMLLANQYIAKVIHDAYPKISILRNHQPPIKNAIKKLKDNLLKLDLNLDITNSKAIYTSLQNLINKSQYSDAMEICLSHLISKPMKRATYFCSEGASCTEDFWHYALSIPIYTHFTSPIRRYPDILVHRVLSAAINYTPAPRRSFKELHKIALICNDMKYNAKCASDDSSNLYFNYFINSKGSVLFRAAILTLFSFGMEVILIETGHIIRITYPKDKKGSTYSIKIDVSKLPLTVTMKFMKNTKTSSTNKIASTGNNDNLNDTTATDNIQIVEFKQFNEILVEVHCKKGKLEGNIVFSQEIRDLCQ